ncbi:MAG TPA: alginate lyase family protein [Bryobacteraceae bacterium]|nr:alginate lyase family protein [Bryobacteraceae bacterium]
MAASIISERFRRLRRVLANPREIQNRLRQEARNAYLLWMPPSLPRDFDIVTPLPRLPNPATVAQHLRDTDFATRIQEGAARIREHRIPLLGITLDTGPEIHWRRDYSSGLETGISYFRRIPYLDVRKAGDHKLIWELNRHQHLVLLAQDWLLHDERSSLDEITAQLESWLRQNPFQQGINWASALEVAFRALSWLWILHFAGSVLPLSLRRRLLVALYQHGCHLEHNLSYYFSPNTHLLGEALALHAVGVLIPQFPRSEKWCATGARVVAAEMETQVQPDGSHFEHSTYYHVYATDMFLFHALLHGNCAENYLRKLAHMAEYLEALLGPARSLPFLGDDDGGRFFHPFGRHDEYGRATLATCALFLNRTDWRYEEADLHPQAAWWLGDSTGHCPGSGHLASRRFSDSGLTILCGNEAQVVIDTGPFGWGAAGHSHSDTLSLVVRRGTEEILIDPGTYTYVGDAHWRSVFRGSASHNTIRVDGQDQAIPVNPFAWKEKPEVILHTWNSQPSHDILDAGCRYRGFTHRRRIVFLKPDLLFIFDHVDGPPGDHEVEQFWHLASEHAARRLIVPGAERIEGWRSEAFGRKQAIPVLRVKRRGHLPMCFSAAILLT